MANKSIKDAFQRFWEYVTAKIDDQKMLLVTVISAAVSDSGDYECDTTFAEIQTALQAGKSVRLEMYVDYGNSNWTFYPFVLRPDEEVIFTSVGAVDRNLTVTIDVNDNITIQDRYLAQVAGNYTLAKFRYNLSAAAGLTGNYCIRNIKFSETAETPTTEGDICFKLK